MSKSASSSSRRRLKYGAFATPDDLARYLARLTIGSPGISVLDPAYGAGALLKAALERLGQLGDRNPGSRLFGYDIRPWRILAPDRKAVEPFRRNLEKADFFSAQLRRESMVYDVILMNPPFIRHHKIPDSTTRRIRKAVDGSGELPLYSNMWAYFMLHSLSFLRKGGTLGAVLPWSVLYANFSIPVRKRLALSFGSIGATVVGKRPFADAEERAVVLVCSEFGTTAREIGICYSRDVPEDTPEYRKMSADVWLSRPLEPVLEQLASSSVVIREQIAATMKESQTAQAGKSRTLAARLLATARDALGFKRLGDFAKVSIGTVTGANDYFVLPKSELTTRGIPEGITRPILTSGRLLSDLWNLREINIDQRLLLLPEKKVPDGKMEAYVRLGRKRGINKRHHPQRRRTWYSIPEPSPPPAFMHYMTKEMPFMVMNPDGVLSTNSIHQVWFKNEVSKEQRKWIQVSALTSVFQVSAELAGRTYGGGVLKIEPSSASGLLVFDGNGARVPMEAYRKIGRLLAAGERAAAMKEANTAVAQVTKANAELMECYALCFGALRDMRLGLAD